MKLQKLTIKNFKGVRDFTLNANGQNVDIFGENGTGKTTVADAFLWLFFDKDSQDKKDFAIKTLDEFGNVFHGLEHEVETVISHHGREVSFRKIYSEQWTKKRGQATAEFTGHTTDHFIDGVPCKKNEFVTRIKLIIEEDIFKLLTSPTYFNEQLHWQQRREILLKVCGDLTDLEVLDSFATFNNKDEVFFLTNMLNKYSLDDYRKIIASRRTKINDELKKIPVRIDEVTHSLPDLTGQSMGPIISAVADTQGKIKAKEQELSRIESGNEITEKRNQIREIDGQLLDLKNQIQGQTSGQIDSKRAELQQAKSQLFSLQSSLRDKKSEQERIQKQIDALDKEVVKLRDDWHIANSSELLYEQADTCPTCGQALPEEKLNAAREKALADFNLRKSVKLGTINDNGKDASKKIDCYKAQFNHLDDEIKQTGLQVAEVSKAVNGLEAVIENMVKDAEAYKEAPAYIAKLGEKQDVEEQIRQLQQDNTDAVSVVKKDIEQLGGSLLDLQTKLAQFDQYEKGQQRINELSDQERNLAAEYEKLEGELFLTEQFIRTKVSMLEEKINSKFQMARFKLFDVQVNGAVTECCETTFKGVPYGSGLNNAARINVGLDIINTLAEHYNFDAPIFIDNREAVTKLIPTRGQQIGLIVSEPDKVLRVVIKGEKHAKAS